MGERRPLILSLTWLLGWSLAAAAGGQAVVDPSADAKYRHLTVLAEVLGLSQRAYVEPLQLEAQLASAVEGMLDAFDPFAVYVPASRWPAYEQARQIGPSRSGLLVLKERGLAYAMGVEPKSPAAEAGIARGSIVTAVAGESTRELPLDRIQALLAGPVGSEVEVEWMSAGERERATLVLRQMPARRPQRLDREGATVFALGELRAGASDELEQLLGELQKTGGERLVLDLRGRHGGDPEAAYSVAGLFVGGELGHLISRGRALETFTAEAEPRWQGQLAVLLDRSTQGAAELLATVLQQAAGAILVGERSFGHCARDSVLQLTSGGRLVLADAFYAGPDQKPLDRSVEPQITVPSRVGEGESERDPVLERAIAELIDGEVRG